MWITNAGWEQVNITTMVMTGGGNALYFAIGAVSKNV